MTTNEKALMLHEEWQGKITTVSKTPVKTREDLALAYTPGVAEPCKVIAEDKEAAYKYTMKANTIAVVSDGSAVLGLGNIGPEAAMPVMEGKAVLFKEFGGVNAVPICLDTQDTEEIIKAVTWLAPTYGGINLEDISAPRCFEIEKKYQDAFKDLVLSNIETVRISHSLLKSQTSIVDVETYLQALQVDRETFIIGIIYDKTRSVKERIATQFFGDGINSYFFSYDMINDICYVNNKFVEDFDLVSDRIINASKEISRDFKRMRDIF